MAYGDPFDAAGADMPPQQAGGVSPDFWRNLAMFGSQMSVAANARTPQGFLAYGNGFAGPFGAGIQGGMQNSMDVAKLRSNLGLQNAQTQDVRSQAATRNIQNKLNLYNLNLNSELYGGPQFDEQGNPLPPGQSSPYSMFQHGQPQGQPQSSAAPAPQDTNSAGASGTPNQNYASLYGDPTKPDWQKSNLTTISAPGGAPFTVNKAAAPAFQGFLADLENQGYKVNPGESGGYNLRNVTGGSTLSPHAYGVAIDINPAANPYSKDANGGSLTTNLPPNVGDLAAKWGLEWGGNWKSLKDPMHFEYVGQKPAQYAQAGNVATDASTAPVSLQPQGSQAPQLRPQQAAPQPQPTMNPLGIAQGILTGRLQNPTPQQALAAAPLIGRINPQLGQELMHYGLAGPQATAESNAKNQSDLSYAGPIAQQKAINSNIDIRPGGMVRVQTPSGPQWIKNPQLEEVQGPNGVTNYVHISPPLPGSPEGTPGTSSPVLDANGQPAVKLIPKQVQEGLDKSYDEFNGKGADSYVAAKNTQGWLEQMDHAAETINKAGGFLTTGPTAPERIALAANVNDILRTTGLPVIFDPKAIGAWEELTKATTTAGFELSSHYEGHARQAAATIENATSAVPAQKNSPIGYYTVSSGIREAAQSAADMREFAQAPVAKKGGDINQAAIDFYKTITPQMYARRAISNVTPYPVKSDTELSRYLPGTFIQYKGNVVQVPERPGAPPIPDYLKNAHPMVPTQ